MLERKPSPETSAAPAAMATESKALAVDSPCSQIASPRARFFEVEPSRPIVTLAPHVVTDLLEKMVRPSLGLIEAEKMYLTTQLKNDKLTMDVKSKLEIRFQSLVKSEGKILKSYENFLLNSDKSFHTALSSIYPYESNSLMLKSHIILNSATMIFYQTSQLRFKNPDLIRERDAIILHLYGIIASIHPKSNHIMSPGELTLYHKMNEARDILKRNAEKNKIAFATEGAVVETPATDGEKKTKNNRSCCMC